MSFEFEIISSDLGTTLGVVPNVCLSCSPSYRLFGGCDTADIEFISNFGDEPLVNKGDLVSVRRDGVPVFSGRVSTFEPEFRESRASVTVDGWWKRLKEREAVTPPLLDHITFGPVADSDHPEITTVYGVMIWILNNRVLNDPDSLIIRGSLYHVENLPLTYTTTKLAGAFVLYAKDDLTKVFETLATMDDCVTGVDAAAEFYFMPRQKVEDNLLTTVYVAKDIPLDWATSNIGVPTNDGRFVYDRRGPNAMAVYSRDKFDAPSIRTYNLIDALPESTKRTAGVRSANLHSGVQARRYARGLFRRFCDYSMKIEELSFVIGSIRLEPHFGRVRVEGPEATVYADKIAGQIKADLNRSTITGSVTLGENAADPTSENPINDPDAKSPGWDDDSQVDTGIGDGGTYPLPSGDIDFNDGFDGDGDDLHVNGDRDFPTDLPGLGVLGVDYGSDARNPDNNPSGDDSESFGATILGVIAENSAHPSYGVTLYSADGTTSGETIDAECWPEPVPRFQIGQKVLVNRTDIDQYFIDGAIHGRGVKLRIKTALPANLYEIELLDQIDETTVLSTFTDIAPYPEVSSFSVGALVFGYWFSGDDNPTPLGGSECCGGYFQGHDDLGFAGQTISD